MTTFSIRLDRSFLMILVRVTLTSILEKSSGPILFCVGCDDDYEVGMMYFYKRESYLRNKPAVQAGCFCWVITYVP